jgi:hypothetical protein
VPGSESALFIEIGKETEVVKAPKQMLVEGKGFNIILDGFHLRNVIVRNAKITYGGGSLILENVYFVNCTFEPQNSPTGIRFAENILKGVPVNFQIS